MLVGMLNVNAKVATDMGMQADFDIIEAQCSCKPTKTLIVNNKVNNVLGPRAYSSL